MIAQTASLFVVLLALGQPPAEKAVENAPEKAPAAIKVASPEQLQRALRELGDDDFKTREKASEFLRSQGLAAEKTLEEALKSEDPEVRERAEAILSDFRAGILPGISPEAAKLIRQFRDGDDQQRSFVFQQLAENGEFEAIPQLLKLEKNENLRRQTLHAFIQNSRAIEKLVSADKLSLLLDAIAADKDENWRTAITLELLVSGKVLGKGTDKKQMELIEKILDDDTQTKVHQRLSDQVFFGNQEAIVGLLENKQLHFVLKIVARNSRVQNRQAAIRQFLSRKSTLDYLLEDQGLKDLLAFSQVKLKGVDCGQIVGEVVTCDLVVVGLVKKRGVDGLLKLPTEMKLGPAERARFLGQLLSSGPIHQELQKTGKQTLIVTLAEEEKDPQLRREYLKGLLTSGDGGNRQLYYFQQQIPQLWRILKQDYQDPPTAESAWQAAAILDMIPLVSQNNTELIRTPEEARWFLQLIRGLKPEVQGKYLHNSLRQFAILRGLLKQGQFDDLRKIINAISDTGERGTALGILGQSHDFVAYLVEQKQVPELLSIGQQEQHMFCRGAYYETLFANAAAMDDGLAQDWWARKVKLMGCD